MDLRQLRYFKAVVTQGSFSEAANRLGRTQQAISKSIAQLEESIGVPLLDRGARTVRPTAVGRLLLQHAETIELQIDSFTEQITSLRQSSAGKVKIGTGPTAATNLLPSALLQLNQKQSQIAIEVYAGIASISGRSSNDSPTSKPVSVTLRSQNRCCSTIVISLSYCSSRRCEIRTPGARV